MKRLICAIFIFVGSIWAEELPGEKALISAVKEGVKTGDIQKIISLYDFTDVDPIYRDLEAFSWKGIIDEFREGNMLKNVSIVSMEKAGEDMKEFLDFCEFEGRFHVPNIDPAGFLVIEFIAEDLYDYYFVVGASKGGVMRIAATKVTTEAPDGYESANTKTDPEDLELTIQGYWVPNVDSFIEQQVKNLKKEDPSMDHSEFVEGMGPLMYAMLGNVAMRIDGDVIETVNLESGGNSSEKVKYKITGTDPATNSVRIQITRSDKPVDQTLTIEKDNLTITEGDSRLKYFRVNKAVFEKRRLESGL